ncbi:MAG TPA: feruloyl-CoA synthase [Burkholderiales bacterium]|nr:feruloyl-CoA synthase [Burkholderiales bacterium]
MHLARQTVVAERRSDGAIVLRAANVLPPYPGKLTEKLEHWAAAAPERVLFAQRDAAGGWRSVTYAQALLRARAIGGYLLRKGLSAERPLVVLSGNDIEHALLHLGAMYVGVPYAPVSPAYSLLSTDFARLGFIRELLTPGLVFANGPQFRAALSVFKDVEVLEKFDDASGSPEEARKAHEHVGPDTIAKFLFTSGSTGQPKAVINTQPMWYSNQAMIASMFAFFRDEPPVIVDWAPWHHTAAGNHDFGLVLYNGGSYYIDEGKPLPGAIEATVRNLREIAPTWYFNVPRGYEALLPYLRSDETLRKNFFSRLQVLWFAGAAIAQHVFDEMKSLARETRGEPIPFLTGLGSTETAPYAMGRMWETADATNMGLPPPGLEMKLVPIAGKLEARLKGPNITPGYWRQPELTAAAFDEEGYYRLGDAFVFADNHNPQAGLLFRGRIAEDFKLATGTWVHVGPLRARFIEHFAPLVRDVVFAGEGRGELGALIFPAGKAPLADYAEKLGTLESTGSSNRVARALVLEEPPSLDAGEVTDKGSINQRAVLQRRALLVDELYSDSPKVLRV